MADTTSSTGRTETLAPREPAAIRMSGASSPEPQAPESSDRPIATWGVPWEESYGYAQAIQAGSTIYVAGQLSHDADGNLVAPAPIDAEGKVTSFANMEAQMRQTYANAQTLLGKFGATLDDVVEETLFVLDVDAAFAVAGKVRKEAYGKQPRCASNLIGTPRLALREQLIEITFTAVLGGDE